MFSGIDYDQASVKTDIAQSIRPLEFVLDPTKYKNNLDQYPVPFLGNDIGQISFYDPTDKIDVDNRPMIDIETDLTGRNRKLSHDPRSQYLPPCFAKDSPGYPAGDGYYTTCVVGKGLQFVQDSRNYTTCPRIMNPPNTLKGTGINRFEHPPLPPQAPSRWEYKWTAQQVDTIKMNGQNIQMREPVILRNGNNSRNFIKDNWQKDVGVKIESPDAVEQNGGVNVYHPFAE
jgi:hypothetical protein